MNSKLDAQRVLAVRNGDAERYRELVERHERRVFAVAWSRMGDPALAEEATQEAFIRAYRQLGSLGDAAKSGGWIAAIARHVAINLGLNHRRELDKRARWVLERAETQEAPAGEPAGHCTLELLRQVLQDMVAAAPGMSGSFLLGRQKRGGGGGHAGDFGCGRPLIRSSDCAQRGVRLCHPTSLIGLRTSRSAAEAWLGSRLRT